MKKSKIQNPKSKIQSAALLCRGSFRETRAKTAHGLIRHGTRYRIEYVVDETCAGQDAGELMGIGSKGIPVVKSLQPGPKALIIGVAPAGGKLPPAWRRDIVKAMGMGMDIVSGLHDFLGGDPALARVAKRCGVKIWDVRRPPEKLAVAKGIKAPITVVLTVGTDAAVGKRTAAIELVRALNAMGRRAAFIATGQTGLMIGCDEGIVVDRLPGDFISGEVERMVHAAAKKGFEFAVVEGQGSLSHHAYGAVTLGLLYGAQPDYLLIAHEPGRRVRPSFPDKAVPEVAEELALVKAICPSAKVLGLALNCRSVPEWKSAVEDYEKRTGLVTVDAVRQGAERLAERLVEAVRKKPEASGIGVAEPGECRLWKSETLSMEVLRDAFDTVKIYEDESHLIRKLLRCRECGHLYFYEFYEEVDWEGGKDPQYRTWIPVDDEVGGDRLNGLSQMELLLYPAIRCDFPRDAIAPKEPYRTRGPERTR